LRATAKGSRGKTPDAMGGSAAGDLRPGPRYCAPRMSTSSPPPSTAKERGFFGWLRDMPTWKKVVVGLAVTTAVVGGVMSLQQGTPTTGSGNLSGLNTSLVGGSSSGAAAGEEPAAKGVFRLGFSFLAGFCMGSFVRSTLKVAAIAFGFWLFLTFVLAQYDIVRVDWQAMSGLWDRFSGNVQQEWGSFQRFMTGSLPAAGLAVTGLAIGLKRH
jgi:uncharacterized membrane protein (Fun14 family)